MNEISIFDATNAAYVMFALVAVALSILYLATKIDQKNSTKKKK